MIQHRFLDHSLRRQQAVYSDGTVITVDFERNTYSIRRLSKIRFADMQKMLNRKWILQITTVQATGKAYGNHCQ